MVSLGVGLVGGLLALFVIKVGLFAVGACLGCLVGMVAMSTPLSQQPFFDHNYAIPVFYGSLALSLGLVATLAQKFFIVLTTALIGTLIFFLGIDYFARSGMGQLVLNAITQFETAGDSHPDLIRAPYVWYGVKYIDLVSLALFSGHRAAFPGQVRPARVWIAIHCRLHYDRALAPDCHRSHGRPVSIPTLKRSP